MGCPFFGGAVGGGITVALAHSSVINALTGDQQLAGGIGTGAGFLSFLLLLMYLPLWFGDPDSIIGRPKTESTLQRWRDAKAESKLQPAEIRCGAVFALIGGIAAAMANASNVLIGIVVVGCAILGGLAGYDMKRRVMKLRKRHEREIEARATDT